MTICIFIKAPVAGRVKTRLYPELAPNRAADLYRAMAQDTLNTVGLIPGTPSLIAYEAHADFPRPEWLTGAGEWFLQEGAGLGERLIHAIEQTHHLNPGPVLVIGTDLPGLTPEILNEATALLCDHDVVLGPASDGGYYLIGLKQPQSTLFQNIPWSTSGVWEATVRALAQAELSFAQLPMMRDLDTPEDLRLLQSDLRQLSPTFRKTQEALHACHAL
ncbi:MAG: hypothetical protein A2992_09420 [Elusimicrobia bacterium RIFCSPLOWO2_01_FULL_59_12]|nr:MAG: hypothetical protein A2992_09420 [Elusimicrobia bacterium RIFCSPLOWO2_01_FULL_59_12]